MTQSKLPQKTIDRIAVILPGGLDWTAFKMKYIQVGEYFKQQDIFPFYVDISWDHRNLYDFVKDAADKIKAFLLINPHAELYFWGFSLGAVLSMILAPKFSPKAQILCSLSPFFKEDQRLIPFKIRFLTKWYVYKMHKLISYYSLDQQKLGKLYFLYGTKEIEEYHVHKVIALREKVFSNYETMYIEDAEHKCREEDYQQAIRETIQAL